MEVSQSDDESLTLPSLPGVAAATSAPPTGPPRQAAPEPTPEPETPIDLPEGYKGMQVDYPWSCGVWCLELCLTLCCYPFAV
jgi:hypothetical protein